MKRILIFVLLTLTSQLTLAEIETLSVEQVPSAQYSDDLTTLSVHNPDMNYTSNLLLRKDRKVGVGFGLGGDLGLYGAQVELNIQDENSARIGFAVASDVQSFSLQWKRSFEAEYFAPYFSAGYARWFNSSEKNLTNKSYVLNAVLDDKAKETGLFTADFLVGSLGMQYYQLDGDWTGAGFYFEFSLLTSLNKSSFLPSGGLGVIYYF